MIDEPVEDLGTLTQEYLQIFDVRKVTLFLTDGIEIDVEFRGRPARYRRRRNRTEGNGGRITRRFTEHEILWTEEVEWPGGKVGSSSHA
jgi:hypothetical protein